MNVMLLWMSRYLSDFLHRALQGGENLASDVSFEATDDLSLAHSLCGVTAHVCPGTAVIKKPDDNDAIERGVGLSMATAVEPMPVGFAGGSRYGIDPAQGGEGSLGMETLGVTPSSYEEGRRRVWSHAEAVH